MPGPGKNAATEATFRILPRDAAKSGARGAVDRLRPDRRQVETSVLPRLGRLDEDAAAGGGADAPVSAQPRHALGQACASTAMRPKASGVVAGAATAAAAR